MDNTGETFTKSERLRKRREFLEVYQQGERVGGKYFFLFFLKNDLPNNRLGITVSRKVGKTVTRNRIKRRLRDIFRQNKELVRPSCDIVVNVKRSAGSAAYSMLEEDFKRTAQRWVEG